MEKELKNLEIVELSQIYSAVKDFVSFLDKQREETEKIREEK